MTGLTGSTITIIEKYGMDDGYLYETNVLVDFTIDPVPFMELEMDEVPAEEAPEAFIFTLDSTLTRFDIDAVESIDLPADAVIVPAEALMELAQTAAN